MAGPFKRGKLARVGAKRGKTINLTQKHPMLKHLQLKMKVLYLLTALWYNTAKLDPCFPFYLLNRMKKNGSS